MAVSSLVSSFSAFVVEWASWSVLLGLAISALVSKVMFNAYLHPLRHVPGPPLARFTTLWILGQTRQGNTHILYPELHRRYGPIVRIAPNKVSLADPAWIPTVYGFGASWQKSDSYIPFESNLTGKVKANIFSTRDAGYHKHMRSTVSSAYSLSSLRPLEPLIDEVSDLFLRSMQELSGHTIDLGEWVQWYAFDVIGNITFSKTFGFLETRSDKDRVISNLEDGIMYASLIGYLPYMHYLLLGNQLLFRFLMRFRTLKDLNPAIPVRKMIDEAMADYGQDNKDRSRGDYLTFLRSVQEKDPQRLSDEDVIDCLSVNLLAGSDTTAMGFRAVLYLITKHPRVYQKLQQEIDQAESEGRLSEFVRFPEASDLTYLQAVIKEALRLHPGIGVPLERVVPLTGQAFGQTYIPGGTDVGMSAWVVNYNADVFGEDASTFRPERWLECDSRRLQAMERASLSFGAGARVCIGKNISMMELNKLVPQLLRYFDLEWASETPEWDVKGLWFAKQSGMKMRLLKRVKT